jgi:hypothetical protein
MRVFSAAILMLVQTAALGQAMWWPAWSEVTGVRYHKSIADRLPTRIVGMEGELLLVAPYRVQPGAYRIVLESARHGGFPGTIQYFELKLEPCSRYYLNAQFDDPVGPDWRPVVDATETIPGCPLPGI